MDVFLFFIPHGSSRIAGRRRRGSGSRERKTSSSPLEAPQKKQQSLPFPLRGDRRDASWMCKGSSFAQKQGREASLPSSRTRPSSFVQFALLPPRRRALPIPFFWKGETFPGGSRGLPLSMKFPLSLACQGTLFDQGRPPGSSFPFPTT